jgi:hypothetical protein
MKPLAIAAAWLLALQGRAEPPPPPTIVPAPVVVLPPPVVGPPVVTPWTPPPNLPPPSEHMIDRFVEGLPRKLWPTIVPPEPDSDRPEALGGLNPGKEAQIAAILRASDACTDSATALKAELVVRAAARRLGMEKLRRLMDLFAGPDFELLDALTDRLDQSATPAAADLAERDRLAAAYPFGEFVTELLRGETLAAADPDYVAAVRKCRSGRSAALARAGIRAPKGQAAPSRSVDPPPAPPAPPAPPGLVLRPPDPPAASEAQVERFLASLPRDAWAAADLALDPETVRSLIGLNPGREAQIADILRSFEKCSGPAIAAGNERVYRLAARVPFLSAEKLERLTAFFGGPDWPRLKAVGDRISTSATPAAADLAERDRLGAAYPLSDLTRAMLVAYLNASHLGAFAAVEKCRAEGNSALAEAGIKTPAGPFFRASERPRDSRAP